jgi:hypothetical protein
MKQFKNNSGSTMVDDIRTDEDDMDMICLQDKIAQSMWDDYVA